jgi:hypothetical protein
MAVLPVFIDKDMHLCSGADDGILTELIAEEAFFEGITGISMGPGTLSCRVEGAGH